MKYIVTTRDVDGASKRVYTTAAKAKARFESMAGLPIENAIWDMLPERETYPNWENMRYVRAVSNFGCVVTIQTVTE